MRFSATLGLVSFLALSACSEKLSEPAEDPTPVIIEEETAEVAVAPATDCASYSETYTVYFDYGSSQMTEGSAGALDTEFQKLLPVVATCGVVSISINQTVLDPAGMADAEARQASIVSLLTEEYNVPAGFISTNIREPGSALPDIPDDPRPSAEIDVKFPG